MPDTHADRSNQQVERPAARGEFLARFGLLTVTVVLAGLAVTGFTVSFILRQQAHEAVEDAAPIVMNLLTRAADEEAATGGDWQRLMSDLARVPNVQACRLEVRNGDLPPRTYEGGARWGGAADGRVLQSELTNADGEVVGTLRVVFGRSASVTLSDSLWTALGMVAIGCLAAMGLIYRRLQVRFRPIGFVRDNLLAYHNGTERSLELLMVQDASAGETAAWNALLEGVTRMQRELDTLRCKATLSDSLVDMQAQASQAILNALPMGVLRVNPAEHVVYANYSARRLLCLKSTDEAEAPLAKQLRQAGVVQTILELRHAVGSAGVDCRLDQPGGHSILRLTPINVDDNSDDLVVVIHDITQLKDAEQSRDEFLAHITHELRTPLTNIRAYAETLSDDFFDDEQTRRECYNVIMTETRRLSKLIEDVLSVSQIEAGAARLTRVPMQMGDSLRQAVQDVQAAADAKSIELSLKIPSKVPQISGDKHRLHQVWVNLVGNAIKYTPAGGSVSVSVEPDEKAVQLRVTDSGIGIAPECHDKVFEKFFRVPDASVNAEEGTGLGLAIVREIVRLHGGSIWVESELGAGATFVVELPCTSSNNGESEATGVTDGAHRDR